MARLFRAESSFMLPQRTVTCPVSDSIRRCFSEKPSGRKGREYWKGETRRILELSVAEVNQKDLDIAEEALIYWTRREGKGRRY